MFKKILFISILLSLFSVFSYGQNIDKVSSRCPSPNRSVYGSVLVATIGDIIITPCPGRSVITPTGTGFVTGTGTATFFPIWTGASTLANSNFTFASGTYKLDNSTNTCAFCINFTPSTTYGNLAIGNVNSASSQGIDINTSFPNNVVIGTLSNANGGSINVSRTGSTAVSPLLGQTLNLGVSSTGARARFDLASSTNTAELTTGTFDWSDRFALFPNGMVLKLQRTITAGGTVGAQTINKLAGTVNFAAGANTLVVTNATVTATSIIMAMARTNDATCSVKNVVPAGGGGSFTINTTAACTAETSVGFVVTN